MFGPNGAGKTTISRALADPDRFSGTNLKWASHGDALDVLVYNRDYVEATLQQAANLPGVFLLGDTSIEAQAEIDQLSGPNGSISQARKRLEILRRDLEEKRAAVTRARDELKEAAWSARSSVPAELQEMFRGVRNSKENLLVRLLASAAAAGTITGGFDGLKPEAAAVLAPDASAIAKIPLGPRLAIEDEPGFELLPIAVLGSADVELAPLIQELGNADWVQHGQSYLGRAHGQCPFCQQVAPPNLAEQIEAYFDKRYAQQIDQLKALRQRVLAWSAAWNAFFERQLGVEEVGEHLNLGYIGAARAELERAIEHVAAAVEAKLTAPSTAVRIELPDAEVDAFNALIMEANSSIETFNLRLRNRAAARKGLIDRCWAVFARRTLGTEVGRFEGEVHALDKAIDGLSGAIAETATRLKTQQKRLRELQALTTSSKPAIETMNRLLDSVGFHSFRLIESVALEDGYSLVRENGEVASQTLSEGERTFITFLYFAQSLDGAALSDGGSDGILAVIDDPISSLDSDVLYTVSTLIKRIVANIGNGLGRVRQLLLLTHNAYFYKEVTYKGQSVKDGGWQYGIIRKIGTGPRQVELGKENPIQSAYGALWGEVKRAGLDPTGPSLGLQNILRRILETYFKVLGGVDTDGIIAQFEGDEQLICRSLFSWVNAGSHSIFDDLDYSHTPTTVEANLAVFEHIFETQHQEGHFRMMMAGATVPGGLGPSIAEQG